MAIPTNEQIELMTITQLTAFWNQNGGKPPIKKFSTKADGIKRCFALAAALRAKAPAAKAPAAKGRKASVSSRCRELIMAGKTNEFIWGAIQQEFGLDESKKYYPAWNRAAMKRNGWKG